MNLQERLLRVGRQLTGVADHGRGILDSKTSRARPRRRTVFHSRLMMLSRQHKNTKQRRDGGTLTRGPHADMLQVHLQVQRQLITLGTLIAHTQKRTQAKSINHTRHKHRKQMKTDTRTLSHTRHRDTETRTRTATQTKAQTHAHAQGMLAQVRFHVLPRPRVNTQLPTTAAGSISLKKNHPLDGAEGLKIVHTLGNDNTSQW